MVNVHFVDNGQIKVLLNDRLSNVRGQIGMSFDHGHRAGTPPFIGGLKQSGRANGKCWNDVQTESCGMVVVDQKNNVWFVVLHPLLAKFIALK
jgi:hypothetical protein